MGKYNRDFMVRNARSGERIGSWKGKPVYSVSYKNYVPTSADDRCFVIYDDGMKFIYQNQVVGTLLESGSVQDAPTKRKYVRLASPSSGGYGTQSKYSTGNHEVISKRVPASAYSEAVSNDEFFSRLDREINELLADVDSWKMPEVEINFVDLQV